MRAIKFFSAATLALAIGLVGFSPAAASGSWSAPVDASLEARDIQQHHFAVDSTGTATAVWMNGGIIQSSSRPMGGNWSTPVDVSLTGGAANHPQVTVDSSGLATAVWYRSNGSNEIVQSSSRPLGGNWSTPVDVSLPGGNASKPQVTVDSSGLATAVWYRSNGTNDIIQSSSRPSGGDWSTPVNVSLEGENSSGQRITVDSSGIVSAIWRRNGVIQSSSRPVGGSWSIPVDVSLPGVGAWDPQFAVGTSGALIAVWERDGTIQASARPVSGNWSTPVDISLPTAASKPQVTLDSEGSATAVWTRMVDGYRIIQSSSSTNGETWSSPVDISSPSENADQPQVTVDPSGEVTAVWRNRAGSDPYSVQSSSLPRGGTWSIPVDLSLEGESGDEPQVKADPTGAVTAVWRRSVDGYKLIQSSFIAGPTQPESLADTGVDASGIALGGFALFAAGVAVAARRRARS